MNAPTLVAVDVGGTAIKGSVGSGPPRASDEVVRRPIPADDPPAAVEAVLDVVVELCDRSGEAAAVGLVVPGLVDDAAGVARYSENIGWRDVRFRDLVGERTGVPVGFGHDVRAGGLAERTVGAGHDVDDLLFLPIGAGISGAMVVEGRMLTNPYGGELGHVDVAGAEDCVCGAHGCLEAVASASAIARRYTRATGTPVRGAVDVLAAADRGDNVAVQVWDDAVAAIARGIVIYAGLLAPEVVVIGGGLSRAGDRLIDPLRTQVHRLVRMQREPRIVASALGADAGRVGAALLAQRALEAARPASTAITTKRNGP
ncbi:ROK family protein [uncultured Jatrophihabitans sp.]|uniref:ROK family protein n=1 Tax=uncultured Jatrophihabitans sp. TaxID=1610747 RepID=UPI0035CA5B97